MTAVCSGVCGLIGIGLGDVGASLPFVAGGVLIGGVVVLARGRSHYVVTTQRVYTSVGLLRQSTSEAGLSTSIASQRMPRCSNDSSGMEPFASTVPVSQGLSR